MSNAANAKFKVGDKVRVISTPRDSYNFIRGTVLEVLGSYKPNQTISYRFVGWSSYSTLSEKHLELVKAAPVPAPPLPVPDWSDDEDKARKVVEVAQRFAEEHGWCEVVDEALVEMGLTDFMERSTEVTISLADLPVKGLLTEDTVRELVLSRLPEGTRVLDVCFD